MQQNLRIGFFVAFVFIFSSCSLLESGEVRDLSEQRTKEKLEKLISGEVGDVLGVSHSRLKDATAYVVGRSEPDVEKVDEVKEGTYVATVNFKVLAKNLRMHVWSVLSKVPASKAEKFNFADAIQLVLKERSDLQEYENHIIKFQFIKNDDSWSSEEIYSTIR